MRKYFKQLPWKGEFAKNTLTLTIGTGIAQAFPMLFYPLLGRLFDPSDFGTLATFTSITAILAVIGTGKYEQSILIAESKEKAAHIVGLVLGLSFTFLLITSIFLFFFSESISLMFNNPSLKKWLIVCPISAFSIIIYLTYNEWTVRNKSFKTLAWNKIFNSGATTLNKVLFGFVHISRNGLILGDVIGRILSAISCIFKALREDKEVFFNITFKNLKDIAKKYIAFPKFSLPAAVIDTVNSQLPILVIAAFFLTSDVGHFMMASSLLSVPASVISLAVMDVFRQRAAEEWNTYGNCIRIYKKVTKLMLIIIAPLSVLLLFFLPDLFSFFLGNNWISAGQYAQILLPNVAILFMFQVVSAVFIIANKMKSSMLWQFYSISLTCFSLYLGCFIFKDIKSTLICYVIARSIANLTRFYLTYKYSKGLA